MFFKHNFTVLYINRVLALYVCTMKNRVAQSLTIPRVYLSTFLWLVLHLQSHAYMYTYLWFMHANKGSRWKNITFLADMSVYGRGGVNPQSATKLCAFCFYGTKRCRMFWNVNYCMYFGRTSFYFGCFVSKPYILDHFEYIFLPRPSLTILKLSIWTRTTDL